ncbi:MAG: VTT domain-containing protein [Myxococcales bacterium]|nr:VTT domain-containing protein [Myxococcales bacterium]
MSQGWTTTQLIEVIRDAGPWGIVGFLIAFALIQPLGISGHVFCLAALVLWPPWLAFILAWIGAVGSAMVSVGLARLLIVGAVPERFKGLEKRLTGGGWWTVMIVRLFTFTAHPVQYLMGVLPIPTVRVLTTTMVAFAPTVALDVFLGGEVLKFIGWSS